MGGGERDLGDKRHEQRICSNYDGSLFQNILFKSREKQKSVRRAALSENPSVKNHGR